MPKYKSSKLYHFFSIFNLGTSGKPITKCLTASDCLTDCGVCDGTFRAQGPSVDGSFTNIEYATCEFDTELERRRCL